MSTKKIVALCMVVAVFTSLLTVGTVAWLQDSDSDVNVMTMGNVKIRQHEYERVVNADGSYELVTSTRGEGYKLQPFTQNKPLLPAVGTANAWSETTVWFDQLSKKANGGQKVLEGLTNVQDKFVLVENTGNVDAYVRTLIAYEMGDLTADQFDKLVGVACNDFWTWNDIGAVEINGNHFWLVEYVYMGSDSRHVGGIVPGGDFTYNSLAQVYMAQEATNEDVNAIDGNNSGTYDILVLSQAVQSEGFGDAQSALDAAFGDVTVNNHPWNQTAQEKLQAVINAAPQGAEITVAQDIQENITVGEDDVVAIDLNATTLTGSVTNSGYVTLKNGTIDVDTFGFQSYGVAQLENVTMKAGNPANYSNITHEGSFTVYNNVTIVSEGGGIGAQDGAEVVFNGTSIAVNTTSTSGRYIFYLEDEGTTVTINGGEFSFSKTLNQKRAYVYAGAGTTVYINGGTFGPASNRAGYSAGIMGDGTVIITGGSFGFDPSNWVAEGYEAVEVNGVWTVYAK